MKKGDGMKAEIKPGYSKERVKLADIIPLRTPFTFYITASHLCNFKCFYCTQSWEKKKLQEINFQAKNLDYDLFLKMAEEIKAFPDKLKIILFTGMGEPLMNQRLPEMIAHLNKLEVAEKIELYTNASLLTKETTRALVNAGLYRMRISLQGLSAKKYRELAGVDVDFDKIVDNIKYFYENRKDCKLYIKIIDSALEVGEEAKFYNIFGNISDEIYIEHMVHAQKSMGDYGGIIDDSLTMYREKAVEKDVCPLIFYILQADVSGNVYPCTPLGLPPEFALGNIQQNSLSEMWNGDQLRQLRYLHLKQQRSQHPVCGDCQSFTCITHPTDSLDEEANRLASLFE
ncbi:MAG: radical SAM/SPASM domain-containing protein [Thermincolia bacterium]